MFKFKPSKIFENIFTYLKQNKLLVILLVVGGLFLGWQFWQLHKQMNFASESSQEIQAQTNLSIAEIRNEYTQQIAAQQEINERQTEELTRLTNEYTQRITALEVRTRARRTTFATETNGNPQDMAARLNKRLGWRTSQ